MKNENPTIFVVKFIYAYLSPVEKYETINNKINQRTKNLSDRERNILSKAYLITILFGTFFLIWLSYNGIKSDLSYLSTYRSDDCGATIKSCSDTWLSGFVKSNAFTLTTITEVCLLVIGVIVGNIVWEEATKIKNNTIENMQRTYKTIVLIASTSVIISFLFDGLIPVIQKNYSLYTLNRFIPLIAYTVTLIIFYKISKIRNRESNKNIDSNL